MTKKICDKCGEIVKDDDNYFEVITYMKGERVKNGYMHRSCNDKMNQQNIEQLNKLSGMVTPMLKSLGITPEEVFELK